MFYAFSQIRMEFYSYSSSILCKYRKASWCKFPSIVLPFIGSMVDHYPSILETGNLKSFQIHIPSNEFCNELPSLKRYRIDCAVLLSSRNMRYMLRYVLIAIIKTELYQSSLAIIKTELYQSSFSPSDFRSCGFSIFI